MYVREEGLGGRRGGGGQRSLPVLGSKLTCIIFAGLHRSHQRAQGKDEDKRRKKHKKTPRKWGGGGGRALYLASLRVFGGVQAHIIDVSVCEVISGSGEPYVDLTR